MKFIKSATLRIVEHTYTSNWSIASARYDVLFGMSWHVDLQPQIDYEARSVKLEECKLHMEEIDDDGNAQITNLSVKKFRSLMCNKRKHSFQVFSVMTVTRVSNHDKKELTGASYFDVQLHNLQHDTKLGRLLHELRHVFRE